MYVQREDGVIVGVFARPQDFTSEWIDDDSQEIADFNERAAAMYKPAPSIEDVIAVLSDDQKTALEEKSIGAKVG